MPTRPTLTGPRIGSDAIARVLQGCLVAGEVIAEPGLTAHARDDTG
jgi:hypothetical protein